MNYIKEINAFYDWLETNSVSDSAITLWHALMHINNKAGWKVEFTVASSVLCLKSGLSNSSFKRARNILKQSGRIEWRERKGNQSAIYKMISIAVHIDPQSEPLSGPQTGPQSEPLSEPINKLNYTKQNNNILLEKESKEEKIEKEISEQQESIVTDQKIPSKKVAQKKVSELSMPEEFIEIWDEWNQYRKDKKIKAYAGPKWEQMAVNKLLELSNYDAETAKMILKQTYECNYQGFFPLKNNNNGQPNNQTRTSGNNSCSQQATFNIKEAVERTTENFAKGNIPGVY